MKDHDVLISTIEHCSSGIVITDSDGNIQFQNEKAALLLEGSEINKVEQISALSEIPWQKATAEGIKMIWRDRGILLRKYRSNGCRIYFFDDVDRVKSLETQIESDKQVFDLIGAGILISNEKGVIEVFNSFLEKIEGRSRDDVVGKSIAEAYHVTSEKSEQLTVLKTKRPLWNVNLNYIINGKQINTLSTTYPIFQDGKIVRVVSISRNITTTRRILENVIKNNAESADQKSGGAHYHFRDILGDSESIKNAIDKAIRATNSCAPIMIYGETGTGKELFAQSIHNGSAGGDKGMPFVAINCAAIPEQLLESILFGTIKGSYTDAKDNAGLFEQASNGTLFLDELNSMPTLLQTKILRVLQEKVVRRLGDTVERPINCRIISSCNQEPIKCVEEGSIREDLYYRLAVISIEIPPLRERGDDVIDLANYFLQYYGRIYGLRNLQLSPNYIQTLQNHSWPGNVRELEHVIESSVAMLGDEEILDTQHLPAAMRLEANSGHYQLSYYYMSDSNKEQSLQSILQETEKQALLQALKNSGGNISRAGSTLGISRQNMQYRMKKFGMNVSGKEWEN